VQQLRFGRLRDGVAGHRPTAVGDRDLESVIARRRQARENRLFAGHVMKRAQRRRGGAPQVRDERVLAAGEAGRCGAEAVLGRSPPVSCGATGRVPLSRASSSVR
jgi:hypothetical protein